MRPDRIPEEVRKGWTRPRIELANELVLQLYRDLRYSVNQRFDLELTISRLAALTSMRTPQELVKEIQALQEQVVHEGAYRRRHGGENGSATGGTGGGEGGDLRGGRDSADTVGESGGGMSVGGDPGAMASAGTGAPAGTDEGGRNGNGAHGADAVGGTPGGEDAAGPPAPELPPEDDIDPNEPPNVEGISLEDVQAVVGRFRTQRISVAALLSRARLWRYADDTLLIAFADEFGANALSSDREVVQGAAMSVLGVERLTVRIDTLANLATSGEAGAGGDGAGGETAAGAIDPQVDMVRRVFRGEIMEDPT
jgi:DNA polymerase-3 subunit gamma/tau